VVSVVAVVNAVMPAVDRSNASVVMSSDVVNDRISTQVDIIHATGVDLATQSDVWVKNVGASRLGPIERTDVFFGPEGNFARIPYGGAVGTGCTAPCWEYELEGSSTEWGPTSTLHIVIYPDTALASGTTYFIKVVAPNGISSAKFFTV
jgi:hypothetical protein